MKNKNSIIAIVVVAIVLLLVKVISNNNNSNDEWHNYDGSPIVCRIIGCGKTPRFSDWDDRFCSEHLNKSENYANYYDNSTAKKKINTKRALTKEEADALRGTGYNGTKPNSPAENIEINAAMVKCKNCGMHSDNGVNSLCYECRYNKDYGFD